MKRENEAHKASVKRHYSLEKHETNSWICNFLKRPRIRWIPRQNTPKRKNSKIDHSYFGFVVNAAPYNLWLRAHGASTWPQSLLPYLYEDVVSFSKSLWNTRCPPIRLECHRPTIVDGIRRFAFFVLVGNFTTFLRSGTGKNNANWGPPMVPPNSFPIDLRIFVCFLLLLHRRRSVAGWFI